MNENWTTFHRYAEQKDQKDELRDFRKRFHLPADQIYFEGNSLGLLPKSSEEELLYTLEEWKSLGIEGWLSAQPPWFWMAEKVGKQMAALMGAKENEVVATGTTTGNLHQLIATFYQPSSIKSKILVEELTFPSDLYAVDSILRLKNIHLNSGKIVVGSKDGLTIQEDDIIGQLSDEVQMLIFSPVLYKSGQLLDIYSIVKAAREKNILVGLDCSHSAGAIIHHLHDWQVDFATWCGYKYLNGGPGCTAFIFVHEKHFDKTPGLAGWFGYRKERQFQMDPRFDHQKSAAGWQISTPNILSLAILSKSLDLISKAGMNTIRKKSLELTNSWIKMHRSLILPDFPDCQLLDLSNSHRGGHICILYPKAQALCLSLKRNGVIVDHRPPNLIRLSPSALYNSYSDIVYAMETLHAILKSKSYQEFLDLNNLVT